MNIFKNMPIEKLNFSVRTYNCLKSYGISTIGDLSVMTKKDFMRIRHLDKKNQDEIIEKLKDLRIFLVSEDTTELP